MYHCPKYSMIETNKVTLYDLLSWTLALTALGWQSSNNMIDAIEVKKAKNLRAYLDCIVNVLLLYYKSPFFNSSQYDFSPRAA